jgi:hypothetical protein
MHCFIYMRSLVQKVFIMCYFPSTNIAVSKCPSWQLNRRFVFLDFHSANSVAGTDRVDYFRCRARRYHVYDG